MDGHVRICNGAGIIHCTHGRHNHREYEAYDSNTDIHEERHRYHCFRTRRTYSTAKANSPAIPPILPDRHQMPDHHPPFRLSRRQLLQIRQRPIEDVAIPTIGILITVLPNRLERPATRNGPGSSGTIPRQHERRLGVEGFAVARAGDPPVIRGIDHRPPACLALVRVDEVGDPVHHAGLGETVTFSALGIGAVLHVEHTGQGSAVAGPTAAVSDKVGCLGGAGTGFGTSVVVTASDQAGGCSTVVVLGEYGVDVSCSFSGLPGSRCQYSS